MGKGMGLCYVGDAENKEEGDGPGLLGGPRMQRSRKDTCVGLHGMAEWPKSSTFSCRAGW